MPFCPNCRYEYVAEVKSCPDCEAELIDELPDLFESLKNVKWVALRPLPGVVYAKMIAEVLDQNEIPNYIHSLFGSGAMGVITGADFAGSEAKIMVPETLKEKAQAIMDDMMQEEE
ncbi:DUF2007 domain-containing protein [bacterium]|nr:DUF2007 domain-containing protein [bacterium]MBU1880489.1 DUF2007 domain-containing protein [bacterium]